MNISSITLDGDIVVITNPPGFIATPDSMAQVWSEIDEACKKYRSKRVLVIAENFERRLTTTDAFDSGVMASQIVPGLRVALCFSSYTPDEMSEFFVTVALNRGTVVRFFQDEAEARDWLQNA